MEEKSIGFEIKAINDLIIKKMMNISKSKNDCMISHTQVKIMYYLIQNKNEIVYQKDIEKFLNLKRSTVSGIIDTMEKNNLIKRFDDESDLRLKKIVLTDSSYNKIKDIKKQIKKFNKILEKNISKNDLEVFYKVTNQIKTNIIDEGGK